MQLATTEESRDPSFLPLRWESTGDQWWYATPIDWAAASGHYDLVRELLRLDPNLLVKLTSLRRIRRLESVWDDDARLHDAARNRAAVARRLLRDCEPLSRGGGHANRLLRAGYGGWLLYTAAAAGDGAFVRELLAAQPLLVFGEGEYGVTDILYAAARSRCPEVFRLLFDAVLSAASCPVGGGQEGDEFRREMMNRAVHAAARGGSLDVLRDLLRGCSDAAAYRDAQGSTILHAAAAKGQLEVCLAVTVFLSQLRSFRTDRCTTLSSTILCMSCEISDSWNIQSIEHLFVQTVYKVILNILTRLLQSPSQISLFLDMFYIAYFN